jgi:transglutaminase-like putative cysteine protease
VKSRVVALAVLAAAIAVALVVPMPLAVAALALPVIATITGPRLQLDRLGQAALTFGVTLASVLAPRVLSLGAIEYHVAMLSERRTLLALPVLAVAASRALVKPARFDIPITLIAALVALTAAGGALTGWSYPLLCSVFLALGFAALAVSDSHRAPLRHVAGRVTVTVAVAMVIAAALVASSTLLLPRLHDAVIARIVERIRRPRTGFSKHLVLDSLRGLLADDRVVMRVRGERAPSLLRGAVFTEYVGNRWVSPERLPQRQVVEVASNPPSGSRFVEIENARRPERYFLPLDATAVTTSSGFLGRDLLGVHYPVGDTAAKRVWFRRGGALRVYDPGWVDLAVPRRFAPDLLRLVAAWAAQEGPPLQRLRRIEAHLRREYGYSLSVERPFDRDPLLDFLVVQRKGHCEYFASAMALLARAVGVPTRVVTGYRVAERSPFGYFIVRQRHAHAWVESWVDGAWISVDPTPPAAVPPSRTPLLSALADAASTGWEAIDDWLQARTTFEFSLALVALVGGLLLLRARRARRGAKRQPATRDPPLAGFVALSRKLTKLGIERRAAETLARFASRVERSASLTEERRQQVAALIRDYALLRYAGRGDSRAIDRRLGAVARTL